MAWSKTGTLVSGGAPARASANATTSSLANGASDSSTTITLATSYRLLSVQTSRAARVRLYASTAARTADLSRSVGIDPAADAGVVLEYVTVNTSTHLLSPLVEGASMETSPVSTIAMTVTNNGSTGTVTVTLIFERTE